jgi:hypothetical protein
VADRLAANTVVLVHLLFVAFVAGGGFLAWRWRWLAWVHLPAALWGVLVEFIGWTCPLTPLENALRMRAGQVGYAGGFVEHYVVPAVYPAGLTRGAQIVLGTGVVLLNAIAYGVLVWRRRTGGRRPAAR